LAAGCLDRLQIAIAPLIIGSGRPSITLPEISGLSAGLRPPTRCLALGRDILVECCFDG
jgi:riboflavin biosynthesis pyrimidine reductase